MKKSLPIVVLLVLAGLRGPSLGGEREDVPLDELADARVEDGG